MKSDIQRMKARIKKARRRIDRGVRVDEETRRVNRLLGILHAKGIFFGDEERDGQPVDSLDQASV